MDLRDLRTIVESGGAGTYNQTKELRADLKEEILKRFRSITNIKPKRIDVQFSQTKLNWNKTAGYSTYPITHKNPGSWGEAFALAFEIKVALPDNQGRGLWSRNRMRMYRGQIKIERCESAPTWETTEIRHNTFSTDKYTRVPSKCMVMIIRELEDIFDVQNPKSEAKFQELIDQEEVVG